MYDIILNPSAGHGKTLEVLPQIEDLLKKSGFTYVIKKTASLKDISLFARTAVENKSDGVIVIGGDGTLSEAASGMANSGVPMLIVSCGTGNDYIKALKLPKDPIESLAYQLERDTRRFDMCRINDRTFLNVAGCGLDVEVLRNTGKYKGKYQGIMVYLYALRDAIKKYAPYQMDVSIDGGAFKPMRFAVLSLGLGNYIGGGIKAVPYGDPADGKLDLVITKPVKKIFALPCVIMFALGLHIRTHLTVLFKRIEKLSVRSRGMTIQVDGELIDCDSADFEIMKGALTLRV